MSETTPGTQQDDRLDLAIVDRATGEYAGEVVLNEHDAAADSANFRIGLRGPAYYGRGLGSEATRLVVDHGLRTMGLRRITLGVLARNPRARRAYEKAGFRVTRTYAEERSVREHVRRCDEGHQPAGEEAVPALGSDVRSGKPDA